jgi:hypothetical protein
MIQRNWGGDLHQLLICKHWGWHLQFAEDP